MEQWRVIASRHYSTRPSETCSDFAPLEKKTTVIQFGPFCGSFVPPQECPFYKYPSNLFQFRVAGSLSCHRVRDGVQVTSPSQRYNII